MTKTKFYSLITTIETDKNNSNKALFTIRGKRKTSFNNYYELSGLTKELLLKINDKSLVNIEVTYIDDSKQKLELSNTNYSFLHTSNDYWHLEFNNLVMQLNKNSTEINNIQISFSMGLNINIKSYAPSNYTHKKWIELNKPTNL